MAKIEGFAPAKINLTLHVTGQRADGYHLLDSLVVFADLGDRLTACKADRLSLSVDGPFSTGVPCDESNLVLKAARSLQARAAIGSGAALTLTKRLPHAAGIGSGSSDAATALQLLSELWSAPLFGADAPEVLALGADVPVCLAGPKPLRMSGIGEVLTPVCDLPSCAIVLARPPVAVPTAQIFERMTKKDGAPMADVPKGMTFSDLTAWLAEQRNDMVPAATSIAQEIATAISDLKAMPDVAVAGMSGSGATCYGLAPNLGTAQQIATRLRAKRRGWWVEAANVL